MRQIILLILFFFVYEYALAQNVQYRAVFMDPCTGMLAENQFFYLGVNDSTFFGLEDAIWYGKEAITLNLPDTGRYLLVYHTLERLDPIVLHIENYGLRVDSFQLYAVTEILWVGSPPTVQYLCCDSLCQGYIEDYYTNGKCRRKGNFNNGLVIDSLVTYYPSGFMKEFWRLDNHGNKTIKYFKDDGISEEMWVQKGGYNYHSTYYDNGHLYEETVLTDCFYPGSGDLPDKNYKRKYHKNGQIWLKIDENEFCEYASDGKWIKKGSRKRRNIPLFWLFTERLWLFLDQQFITLWDCTTKIRSKNEIYLMDYQAPEYLDEISSLDKYFYQILLYQNKKLFQKIEYEYEKIGEELQTYVCYYERINGQWRLQKKEKDEELTLLKAYLTALSGL